MERYVIDPEAAIRILQGDEALSSEIEILAPTLLRSQVLNLIYVRVQSGEVDEASGLALNARFAKLKLRYLGDAVLRRRAWSLAAQAGMASTFDAEYLALTQLQADALVAGGDALRKVAKGIVTLAPFGSLTT